jgi:Putative exonuclease SbcCD, C subunit
VTLEELTTWRVAAIEGQLPTPARSDRWQPLRAGVVNLWEYDATEVWYADGRMQLQGANESGKSTLMTLTTLLLLAGDASGHNIDTLGASDKHFRYYVEPTDHALDRRDASTQKSRGWAWLEFGKGTEFFTVLLFAEARRADGDLKLRWCTATGTTRVRSGLSLVTAGFVADPAQFRDLSDFVVHSSGTVYREAIARTLYGTDEQWLNQLNRILRVIRTPQIGHKIDLKFLTESFRTALPPIAADEIGQLADGWEQLQRLRNERDEAEQALEAVAEFSRRQWRPWADAVIRAAADPVAAAASALTQITRQEREAAETVEGITADRAALDKRKEEEDEARLTATARRDALQQTSAYEDAKSATANAQQLAERADEMGKVADRSEGTARRANAAAATAGQQLSKANENLNSAEHDVVTAADQVTAHGSRAGLTEITAQYLPGYDTPRLRQAADLRTTAANKAVELIAVHAEAARKLTTATEQAGQARKRLSAAQVVAARQVAAVENAINAVGRSVSDWARALDERIRPSAELVESWCRQVAELTDAPRPGPVLLTAITREHLIPARRPHDDRRANLERDLARNVDERKAAQEQLYAAEAERDPRPRDPEFWLRRQRPEGLTADGAPFWRLVETLDNCPAAGLEAALDAAGLLQAWVTPDGVYLASRDGNETVWAALPHTVLPHTVPAGPSLQAVLRPADDAGGLADVIDRLLGCVGFGDELGVNAVSVTPDGRWRHGQLAGTAAPSADGPKLLGAAARAADRERRIARLQAQLKDLADDRELFTLELDEVNALLAALDEAAEHLPDDTQVVTAVFTARDAAQKVAEAADDVTSAEDAEREARTTADAAAADVSGHCEEHGLPRAQAGVATLLDMLSDYRAALKHLEGRLELLGPLRDAVATAKDNVEQSSEEATAAAENATQDREAALSLRTKADAARAALTQEAQEILREVGLLIARIKTADELLNRLADERGTLTGRLARAEEILKQAADKRGKAEEDREAAVNRWWSCVDTGLPHLRGVAEPSARHVTAALETARAARSSITIRDWPDDPQATGQRVQARWGVMVNEASGLRSRLETLGGRTVRVITPGDGADDFPGGVDLMVDGTGAALAPPAAAERLSGLLIRLQEDYDEELTKTIDELLGSTFIEHLRDRLAAADALRTDINAKLLENPLAVSGITLRLRRVAVSEERAANDVLDALERDFDLLPKPAQKQIRDFLAERITSAQEEARTSGDPQWRARLAQILDYRRWFDLRLEYRTPRSQSASGNGTSEGWRTLARGDHGLLSGGAKVVTLMQPFIAALHAMYDQAIAGPRMLWLDEAFGGVDGPNKASMFRLLGSCDLDWLIAGPGIIANSAAVPLAAIYEVRRAPQPLPGVSLELAVWSGNELTAVLTPDPADLRDLAAPEYPADDDTLFSGL